MIVMLRKIFIGFLIYSICGFPTLAFSLPQGGEVVSGTVGINTPSANDMAISQGSNQAIVNWQGFDIGQQESVTINQPNSNSVILNRVVGQNPSEILGRLSANGQVFLTNPSGILFGQGAQVNVGALIASTLNISNQDFLNRNYRFTQDTNKPLASIINLGDINARSVGLLAPRVENHGNIVASLGSVAIASGEKAALDFEGDGLINFEITQPVSGEIRDGDGNVIQSGVVNSGLIQANGGRVVLSALQAQSMIQSVVNNEGMIEAKGVEERDGKIFLLGADEVFNSGTLDASNKDSGRSGGTVHVLGDKVGVFGNAHINASGDAGGGTILIGGDFQGSNPEIQNAYRTYVGTDAVIIADATNTGNGGKVIVWADDVARFYGNISAKGGAVSGDGGFVETSGKKHLEFLGDVDITATNGNLGTLLLDPQDIIIADGAVGAENGQVSGDSVALFADGGAVTFTIAEQTLEALTGNIILQATQDITINDLTTDGVLNLSNLTSGESVVFQAGRNITFSNTGNTLSTGGGNIHLEADSPHSSSGAADGSGTLTTGILSSSGGAITLIGTTFSISGAINSGSGNINMAKAVDGQTLAIGSADITDAFLDLITTTGTLIVGQATTAGTDGAGSGATTLNAGSITVNNVSNTTATNFTIVANDSISFTTSDSSFSSGTLTIDANGTNSDVAINVGISTASGGAVTITADDSVVTGVSGNITAPGAGAISVTSNTTATDGDGTDGIIISDGALWDSGSGTISLISTGTNAGNIALGGLTTTNATSSAISVQSDAEITDSGNVHVDVVAASGTINLVGKTGMGITGANTAIETTTSKLILDSDKSIAVINSTTLTDLTMTVDPGGGTNTYNISDGGNLTLSLTDSGTDLDIGGLSLSSGNLNFSLSVDTGNVTTSGNVNVGSGNASFSVTAGSLTVNSTKQIIVAGSSSINITAAGVTLSGSSSGSDNLKNTGSGGININSTGNVVLNDNSINLASGGALLIDAGSNTITTPSSTGPNITVSSGSVRLVAASIGTSTTMPIFTSGLTNLAATATTGNIFLNNLSVHDINSTTISSTVGVVASGSINIINSGGFTFTDIIKSNNGSIDIVSEFSVTDLNGTATSLSAENGTVTVKINSSGNFGATGNPIEIRAKGRSITVQSGSSIFDSFTDTTATESTTETTTTSTTTTTDTPPPPAPGSGPPPVGGERFTSDNVPQGFPNTPEAIAQLNKDNSTGVQAGFIEAIEGIVKGPGC